MRSVNLNFILPVVTALFFFRVTPARSETDSKAIKDQPVKFAEAWNENPSEEPERSRDIFQKGEWETKERDKQEESLKTPVRQGVFETPEESDIIREEVWIDPQKIKNLRPAIFTDKGREIKDSEWQKAAAMIMGAYPKEFFEEAWKGIDAEGEHWLEERNLTLGGDIEEALKSGGFDWGPVASEAHWGDVLKEAARKVTGRDLEKDTFRLIHQEKKP